ncbi:MAG TPA: DNA phosphorothioation system sulfurtransferase DndC [Candidatus Tumulicola sp.]|nr:DNA phosphorothioation system sulfurtransferase DndC [Candidatus Tumulicola sp.]
MDLKATIDLIKSTYQADLRPWVIGFSGGKDSTCALQLVWQALRQIPDDQRLKPIYVLSSNTLVESPAIVDYIRSSLEKMGDRAASDGISLSAKLVEPLIEESFWVNLIGRGYPAPTTKFRWCTDRLKISPANRFIKDQVTRFGEVVLVLGVRSSESATRSQVMAMHEIDGSVLRTHSTLQGALVFAPIADWTTDDVWSYLLQNAQTPWGTDNNDLAAMYRAADGECPLVVDTTTQSCGNSRFGCWVCTVVTRDKSMEAMIDSGQSWMEELLEIRDLLAETQQEPRKSEVRSIRKLDGRILLKDSGDEAALGPYTLDFCKILLEKLIATQARLPAEASGFELISEPELLAIRRIWREERHDWEDSVPRIFDRVSGRKWRSLLDEQSYASEEAQLLERIARESGVPSLLIRRLIDAERDCLGVKRRAGIYARLNSILDEDWRDDQQVVADITELKRAASP